MVAESLSDFTEPEPRKLYEQSGRSRLQTSSSASSKEDILLTRKSRSSALPLAAAACSMDLKCQAQGHMLSETGAFVPCKKVPRLETSTCLPSSSLAFSKLLRSAAGNAFSSSNLFRAIAISERMRDRVQNGGTCDKCGTCETGLETDGPCTYGS